MATEFEQELKVIRIRLFRVQLVGIFGTMLLALGLYGLFGDVSNSHPMHTSRELIWCILLLGVAIILWQFSQIAKLQRKRMRLLTRRKEDESETG